MSENVKKYNVGAIVSADITVPNAGELKDFYTQVIGWTPGELKMGEQQSYVDYIMKDSAGSWVAGVCHAQGGNMGIPPQWIVYINVDSVKDSVEKCKRLGGKIIKEVFDANGNHVYAMLQDPVGAVIAVTHVVQ
ncbi:VOC family protein [Pseudochryseolinea flava]|uniref:VOC family protein n=1 Tax=Pseudochryseolinea flava TaxID=2059302 RepID=A0A364Y6X6_9BACT|nr:VOC family protein [Pseudochryseolinea flava]RAW02856.1 VOC family protein [Pseudochryseolinea flava]